MNQPGNPHPRVAVIGGGISGLAATWALMNPKQARDPKARAIRPQVTIYESSDTIGGKIRTSEFAGVMMEEGPDAFLARSPWATHLCHQLGLEDELISPQIQQAWLWGNQRLQPFPAQTLLGVPSRLHTLRRNKTISWKGTLRTAADYLMPSSSGQVTDDRTIAATVGRRVGKEVLYTLVDPLVGGINAGSVDTLSLTSAMPQLAELMSSQRSLMRAIRSRNQRKTDSSSSSDDPVFFTTRGGLSTMVEALGKQLLDRGVSIELHAPVERIAQQPDGIWVLSLQDRMIEADAVIVTTPAHHAATILHTTNAHASALLQHIRYASVAIVRLAYGRRDVAHSLDGSGFVVPAKDGHLVTACSWASSKWEHVGKSDHVVLRASVGRIDDDRFAHLSDDELINAIHLELSEALDIERRPQHADVTRWMQSFPQYEIGHAARVREIERLLQRNPAIQIAGAAYHGLGIPSCIHSGTQAGERILGHFGSR